MSRDTEWSIGEEIQALIWFTRVMPLLMLAITGALYIRVAFTPVWISPTPDPQTVTSQKA